MAEKKQTRTITPRIPEELHKQLTQEANAMDTSVNKLCIQKLSVPSSGSGFDFVPDEQGGHITYRGKVWRPELAPVAAPPTYSPVVPIYRPPPAKL